ncbi:MAG: phosphotransferase [Candidatus Thermoplasmatota archaeon]|nr:phosphotransferase [Candidatus Thermoplasmatota archaeon]
MKTIQTLFSTIEQIQTIKVVKTFQSKKHTVSFITINKKPFVLKWYQPGFKKNMLCEYQILSNSSINFAKPIVFEKNEKYQFLLLEYIKGTNLCDILNMNEIQLDEKIHIIHLLAHWFAQFHQHFQTEKETLLHGDAHIRNFLYANKIFGLDFEETHPGLPIEDLADVSASILTTNPQFTKEKKQLQQQFIQYYEHLTNKKIQNSDLAVKKAIKKTVKRRKQK